jgi:hypothetical protein
VVPPEVNATVCVLSPSGDQAPKTEVAKNRIAKQQITQVFIVFLLFWFLLISFMSKDMKDVF